jgi:hypothetical protein
LRSIFRNPPRWEPNCQEAGATSGLVAPRPCLSVGSYRAVTGLDLADCGPDPALLPASTVNR